MTQPMRQYRRGPVVNDSSGAKHQHRQSFSGTLNPLIVAHSRPAAGLDVMIGNRDAHAGNPSEPPLDARDARGRIVRCTTALTLLSIVSAAIASESPLTSAQRATARPDDGAIDTVTVEALRQRELLERQLDAFVSAITMPAPHESLARWQLPICLLVGGLPVDEGKFVFQRVSQVARAAGIPPGAPDCAPNLLIVMTTEPEALLEKWWSRQPRLFNQDRGVGGIKRTIRTASPVRVFYNACSVPSDLADTFSTGMTSHCGKSGIPDSRLSWGTVRVLYSVIIAVDKRQTEHLALEPLTDYIAMISLAQIRRSSDLQSAPTILRLFDATDATPPQALSAWDRAFLKALYDTDASTVTHRSEIKRRMKLDLAQ